MYCGLDEFIYFEVLPEFSYTTPGALFRKSILLDRDFLIVPRGCIQRTPGSNALTNMHYCKTYTECIIHALSVWTLPHKDSDLYWICIWNKKESLWYLCKHVAFGIWSTDKYTMQLDARWKITLIILTPAVMFRSSISIKSIEKSVTYMPMTDMSLLLTCVICDCAVLCSFVWHALWLGKI